MPNRDITLTEKQEIFVQSLVKGYGYVIRREIIYKIAMNCYALQLFNIK